MTNSAAAIEETSRAFYRAALGELDRQKLPYLVGGAYAFAEYAGIVRHTKDFDIFIRPADWPRAMEIMEGAGYKAELAFPHWLGKAVEGDNFIDLIFGAGNGVAVVDDVWFEKAVAGRVLDMDVKLIPAEEMIWSKGLIMERERFDGADVAHVIRAVGAKLDWRRLVDRYALHWRALYAHIVLFGFIYPSHRANVPVWVIEELTQRLLAETKEGNAKAKVCNGTILSREQYLVDINEWGYEDARLKPRGNMNAEQIRHWTAGIEKDGSGKVKSDE